MIETIASQYDYLAKEFVVGTEIHNEQSRSAYYGILENDFKKMNDKKVLDVGCGDGYDLFKYYNHGAKVYGIDSSSELVKIASERIPEADIRVGLMEKLPYEDSSFDIVLSKYVLQTSVNVSQALKEMDRVLKPKGTMAYLTVHPIRQFLEKKKHPKDYFTSEIVESLFFEGKVAVREPTHTMNEYLSSEFLKKYRVTNFIEQGDFPSSEKVDGDTYPCFFVLRAEKI